MINGAYRTSGGGGVYPAADDGSAYSGGHGSSYSGSGSYPGAPVEVRPSYRCATCRMEFGSYEETRAHALTHSRPLPQTQPQHYPPSQASEGNTTHHKTTMTYPSSSSAPSVSGYYSQQHERKVYAPQGSVHGGGYPPQHPPPPGYGYPQQHPPQFQPYDTPNQGPPPPAAVTTVRSHTRRTTHPDGSVTVTEETVKSDGRTVTRTTRYPAPPPPRSQPSSPPRQYQQRQYRDLPPHDMAQSKPTAAEVHPSSQYEDVPVAEVSYAEPAPNGEPFW